MKRAAIISLLLLCCLTSAWAQRSIADIRKAYKQQKELMAQMSDDFPAEGIPPQYYQLRVAQNLPGTGVHQEDVRFYYSGHPSADEDDPYPTHALTYASASYNFAARQFWEEYLYDDDGRVCFIYARTPDVDFPKIHELRIYLEGNRLLRFSAKEAPDASALEGDADAFKQVYEGKEIPENFADCCERLANRADANKQLFQSIDSHTYK